jgi:hypothetical protein
MDERKEYTYSHRAQAREYRHPSKTVLQVARY